MKWEHVQVDGDGVMFDHLVAYPTGFVTLRLRADENDDWVCGFTVVLRGSRTLPEVENWMRRSALLLDAEPIGEYE